MPTPAPCRPSNGPGLLLGLRTLINTPFAPRADPAHGRGTHIASGIIGGKVGRNRSEHVKDIQMDLDSKLGIIGGGANHDHGIHPEAFRLAADLVERARTPDASAGKCPADGRIESFLGEYFRDLGLTEPLRLAAEQLVLPRHGVARALSIPEGENSYRNPILRSYRVRNGVLHNPRSDRRTTEGTFHVAEGGLPIPATRRPSRGRSSPRCSGTPSARRTSCWSCRSRPTGRSRRGTFVSLLLRPVVCPRCPASAPRRRWRSASSPRAAWSATSTSSSRSSATPATRTCPRTTPGWTPSTGPATPAASSSRRT